MIRAVKMVQAKILESKFERNFPTAASRPEVPHRNKPLYCRPCKLLMQILFPSDYRRQAEELMPRQETSLNH